jgi:multisubunit Na+/H+ antiporter MnhG subunit
MVQVTMKPYVKLAYMLVLLGMALFFFERYGLTELGGASAVQLDGALLSLLVIAPIALVVIGCAIFVVGRVRRL